MLLYVRLCFLFSGQEGLYREESEKAAEGWNHFSSCCHGQSRQHHPDQPHQRDAVKVGGDTCRYLIKLVV